MWKKTGLVIDASAIAKFSVSHAAIPLVHQLRSGTVKLFFASRDEQSRSSIYCADLDFSGEYPKLKADTVRKAMGLGQLGAFDDSGVMPGCIMPYNNALYMYYTGWSLGKTVPFYNFIGLAKSMDGGQTFERVSQAPIMDRNSVDPYLANSPFVLKEGEDWKMWYVSGKCWEQTENGPKHYYFIRYAHSKDSMRWTANNEPCIDFVSEDEYAIARPRVLAVEGGYLMWYSYRGTSYRLGLAASRDGIKWQRIDDKVEIDVSASGWDSQMIAYADIFYHKDRWWMFYNGNNYGKTGIGAAWMKALPSLNALF